MKNCNFLILICLTSLFIFSSCQKEEAQKKEEISINLEYSSNLEWLEEQGYTKLEETHQDYDYIMSLIVGNDGSANQTSVRAQSCQWIGRVAFGCDSGSGGTCTVFLAGGTSPFSACLVCVGGNDDGAADCVR